MTSDRPKGVRDSVSTMYARLRRAIERVVLRLIGRKP